MSYFNPTGGELRNDAQGQGHFGASRGSRKHNGRDITGNPGSYVCAPADGTVVRTGKPYGDGRHWDCYLLMNATDGVTWRLFYVRPLPGIVGSFVSRGQAIGILQDVSERYPANENQGAMLPHCHLERIVNGVKVDPGAADGDEQ